jgi:predicted RNase H-like HicB family nuclease
MRTIRRQGWVPLNGQSDVIHGGQREEDGVWSAHAQLRPGAGAHGEGETEEAALEDLREALVGLIEEFGVPRELSVTVAA